MWAEELRVIDPVPLVLELLLDEGAASDVLSDWSTALVCEALNVEDVKGFGVGDNGSVRVVDEVLGSCFSGCEVLTGRVLGGGRGGGGVGGGGGGKIIIGSGVFLWGLSLSFPPPPFPLDLNLNPKV